MLIGPPFREARKILFHQAGVGVKYMWAVAMDQNPGLVIFVERVPADMRALVNHQNRFSRRGEPLGNYGSRETRSHDEHINFGQSFSASLGTRSYLLIVPLTKQPIGRRSDHACSAYASGEAQHEAVQNPTPDVIRRFSSARGVPNYALSESDHTLSTLLERKTS